jgi:hypothetical protein
MNVETFMKALNDVLYSGEINGQTEVILTTLDAEHGVSVVEAQHLSGKAVLTIHTDEE